MKTSRWLPGISLALMVAALYMVFIYVPTEASMGIVQRIFYFHVPVAWVAFLAFFLTFLGGIQYLRKREKKWDFFASASAELGLLFTTLVLITGPIWAKPIWGVWWTWDARLTTSLVLWLIYVAYFIVRSYIAEDDRRARFAASGMRTRSSIATAAFHASALPMPLCTRSPSANWSPTRI